MGEQQQWVLHTLSLPLIPEMEPVEMKSDTSVALPSWNSRNILIHTIRSVHLLWHYISIKLRFLLQHARYSMECVPSDHCFLMFLFSVSMPLQAVDSKAKSLKLIDHSSALSSSVLLDQCVVKQTCGNTRSHAQTCTTT